MSNSNEILRKCCRCQIIQDIESFSKGRKSKDGLHSLCKFCLKDYFFKNLDKIRKYNERNRERRNTYLKNKRETDVNFRLISKTRNRIYKSSKCMTKSSSAKDILGIDIETYKRRIKFQMTPEMNWTNIELDLVKPICMFDVSDDEQLKETFNWRNTQPLSKKEHQQKGTKFNFLDYQLHSVEAYQFIKLNDQGGLN